jgi:leucyl aminopeptidase
MSIQLDIELSTVAEERQAGADSAVLYFIPQSHEAEHPPLVDSLISGGRINQSKGQLTAVPTHGLLPEGIVMIGALGKDEPVELHTWREIAVRAARQAIDLQCQNLTIMIQVQGTSIDWPSIVYALSEGLQLGAYKQKSYRSSLGGGKEAESSTLSKVWIVIPEASSAELAELKQAVRTGQTYAAATNYARDLTNMPGNMLYPEILAQEAVKLAQQYDSLDCEVLGEQEIEAAGMGGLAAVGQGSARPPRMITLKYWGQPAWSNVHGLIGKGITFDTGGISLKKSEGMEEMISDMGGAAVVLGVIYALAELSVPINVVAVIPSAENMPSGQAYRPGDIITTLSGRTVEVLNTDAEGRIVLADGLTYAKQQGAERLIEISTLTGAVLTVLGDVATAAVTNNDDYLNGLLRSTSQSGERIWPLPAYPEYWDMIKSDVADIKNSTSNRWAGVITAALFIGTFAEDTPWIHLDTGGTAWLWGDRGIDPKGGSGAMVRSLLHFLNPITSY